MAGRRDPGLATYRRKRRFEQTPEPAATRRSRRPRNAAARAPKFVVHLHHARSRHFDLRLQVGQVLKSWAVPKGPSRDPAVKRLAIEVEDHPLGYAEFEGTIPEGHYGAGDVAIWDQGTWHAFAPIATQIKQGHLRFELDGARLGGAWSLIRIRPRGRQPQWLLVKAADAFTCKDDVADDTPLSQWNGGGRSTPTARSSPRRRSGPGHRRAGAPPAADEFELELARLHHTAPEDDTWLHEVKYDGYRMLAWRDNDELRLESRNRLDWTRKLPAVARAMGALKCRTCVLDGELVVFDDDGRSRFDLLQREFNHNESNAVRYVVFDLLWLDGKDLRPEPLEERKDALATLLEGGGEALMHSGFLRGHGPLAYRQACEAGLEGIISKVADAPYRGGRGNDWRKLKCVDSDEFVIVGYTPGKGARGALGALLLATPRGRWWRYAGRVGTGMDTAMLAHLHGLLKPTHITPKLVNPPAAKQLRGATPVWVRPRHVAEISFRGRTGDGLLRQASFKGLRPDKSAADLLDRDQGASTMSNQPSTRAGSGVRLTHPDRVLIPKPKVTKQALVTFYSDIAAHLLPGVVDRPLSLARCPEGTGEPCFYQKHPMQGMPAAIRVGDARTLHGEQNPYLYVDDIEGVLGLVQMNAIELHPWGSTNEDLEHPDRLVFDVDPDPSVAWTRVKAAARLLRERLDGVGLASYLRTTGGKGLHLVVPLDPRPDWEHAKAFAYALAQTLEQDAPEEYVAVADKNRRKGRIFIDYLRNARGATAIASYSVRARPGAPVATPLRWDELARLRSSAQYTIENIQRRLGSLKQDPWHGFADGHQALPTKG